MFRNSSEKEIFSKIRNRPKAVTSFRKSHVIAYLTKLFLKRDFSEMESRRDLVLTAFDQEVS